MVIFLLVCMRVHNRQLALTGSPQILFAVYYRNHPYLGLAISAPVLDIGGCGPLVCKLLLGEGSPIGKAK